MPAERNVSVFFKIRVCDYPRAHGNIGPSNDGNSTVRKDAPHVLATIKISRPDETTFSMMTEGRRLKFFGVRTANKHSKAAGPLFLMTTRSTRW